MVADLLREGRATGAEGGHQPPAGSPTLLNKPKNVRQVIQELFDRLPESMTDQTRTGTYGSWYNYYVCGFAGEISLPPA